MRHNLIKPGLAEFKALLLALENSTPRVQIRLRMANEPWMENFSTVILVSQNATILSSDPAAEPKIIFNLKNVAEFEIDRSFLNFEPNIRYSILPSPE
jgi:hypothetical protein